MAGVQMLLFFSSFFLSFSVVTGSVSPCNDYHSLDNPYRSPKYKLLAGDKVLCDNKRKTGWHRFTSIIGGKMPTTKPEPYHCGTVGPMWMRGTHPTTKDQVVQATLCTNLYNRRRGCVLASRMFVKHCGTFFVYHLKPSRGCFMAYCAGDLMPCPRGQVGIYPNCTSLDPFPYHRVPIPTVSYLDNNQIRVSMQCKFLFPLWKNVSFDAQWFADGINVKNDTICKNTKPSQEAPLCDQRHSELPFECFHLGQRVRCRLRMRYNTKAVNKWTAWRDSDYYFVGIEITPTHAIVKECDSDKTVNITLRPTVPVVSDPVGEIDYVEVKVYVPRRYKGKNRQSVLDSCSLKLRTEDIKYGKQLEIKGICDNQEETDTSLEYHFFPEGSSHPLWGYYRYSLPSVRVTIKNTQTSKCEATGDPHYSTFDKFLYNFYKPGDYVLYRNKKRKLEVHTRLWTCRGNVACNCGVAIREGNDVIVFTICNKELKYLPNTESSKNTYQTLRVRIRSTGPLAPGTHVYKEIDGNKISHNVILPSGTRVKAVRYGWGIDVYLNAPKGVEDNHEGLCGNFNGDPNDDFDRGGDTNPHTDTNSFVNSWRVTQDKSYFEILPPKEPIKHNGNFCTCPIETDNPNITCQVNANIFEEFSNSGIDIVNQLQHSGHGSKRETLYTDDIMDYEERSFNVNEIDEMAVKTHMRVKREVSGLSKENATRYCKSVIEGSTAAKTCSDVPGFSVTTAMLNCIEDLKITGDKKFADSAFNSMKEECEEVALRNISLFTVDENGELKPPTEIADNLCPSDCSHHGICRNRTCICEEGYTANDCSMLVNAVPILLGIYDGGSCDIRRRPCKKIDIFGEDFMDSDNLTCHIQEFKVVPSSWKPKPYSLKYDGTMIDIFGVRCNLPDPPTKLGDYDHEGTPAGGVLISVSNDGERKSRRQMRFVSYDSVCMKWNKSGNSTLKENSCLINGHCFASSQPNPRDWCQQCMPGRSQSSWTPRKDNRPPQFARNQSTRYAVQGEYLPLQLQAKDPDNRPVKYSLINSTATGYTFFNTGLLKWKVIALYNGKFEFQVTDECNSSDTITITIRILSCPCQNGGKCSPHPYYPRGSGQYYCTCPQGFTGGRCETNIDDCVGVNCGNGNCVDGFNNYTCRCHVGFTGSLCNHRLQRCTNQTCIPGVTCTNITTGVSCGPCPAGFSDDGKTCKAPTTTAEQPTQSTSQKLPLWTSTHNSQSTTEEPSPTDAGHGVTTMSSKEPIPTITQENTLTMDPEPTATHKQKSVIRAEIRLLVEWREDFKNKQSSAFRRFADRLSHEIRGSFDKYDDDELDKVVIISLRPGSIVAEFQLVFNKKQDNPLAPINETVQTRGMLGNWTVDPESLRLIKENKERPSVKDNTKLIALVVGGVIGALVAAALVITICRKEHRKSKLKRRISGLKHGVRPDAHCENDLEKYEMKNALNSPDKKRKDKPKIGLGPAIDDPGLDIESL